MGCLSIERLQCKICNIRAGRESGTSRRSVKLKKHCNGSSARRFQLCKCGLCGLWDWLNTYLSNHRDEPLWTLVIFWLNRVLTHVHCHPCGRFCFVCFPSLSRSAGFQEFSQKELAAKTVSLNQLNDQSTSEVRESVVSQAGSNILFFPEICDQSCQTSPSRRRVQLKSNSLERPSLGSFTDVTGYILKVW